MGRSLAILAIGLVAAFFILQFTGGGSPTVEAASGCPTAPPLPSAKPPCYLVNATADLPDASLIDPKCEVAPIASGKCTLRAAIQQANAEVQLPCTPCTIKFDPAVFPKGPPNGPAIIRVDTAESGNQGLLPAIQVHLTIDASNVGVLLEPSIDANPPSLHLDYGLLVVDDTPNNPTDFTLLGNPTSPFQIRGFQEGGLNTNTNGDGIKICGHSVQDAFEPPPAGPGYNPLLSDCDGDGPVQNVNVSNLFIGLKGDEAFEIVASTAENINIDRMEVVATGSQTNNGHAIEIDASGGTGSGNVAGSITNSDLHAAGEAIEIDGGKCLFNITDNTRITGLGGAIDMGCQAGSQIHVEDNGHITGKSEESIDIHVGDGSLVTINRNGDLNGGANAEAIDIDTDGGLGLVLEVIANGHIQGGDDGINVTANSGALITIRDNSPAGTIIGQGGHGIDLQELGDGSNVTIRNNGHIKALDADEGIAVDTYVGGVAGDNLVLLIELNGDIFGGADSIYLTAGDAVHATIINNGNIMDHSSSGYGIDFDVRDDFVGLVDHNGNITGGYEGIDLSCDDGGSLTITNNGDIIGWDGSSGYGIYIGCSGGGDDISVLIENNGSAAGTPASAAGQPVGTGNIIGGYDGIYFSTNDDGTLVVRDNGNIVGSDYTGIETSTNDTTHVTAVNNGNILGGEYGFYLYGSNDQDHIITDNGEIEGWAYYGIYIDSSDRTEATIERNGLAGSIKGGEYGIYFSSSSNVTASIRQNGDIIGYESYAIYCSCSDDIVFDIVENGDITGGEYGVYCSCSSQVTFNILDNGDIIGYEYYAIYCSCSDDIMFDILRNGDIRGGQYGIYCSCSDEVTFNILDNGDITGDEYYSIYCSCSNTITFDILRNGNLVGGQYGVYCSCSDDINFDILDNGNIEGWEYYGVYCSCSNDINFDIQRNGGTGTIEGGEAGIYCSCSDDVNFLVVDNGDIIGYDYSYAAIYMSNSDRTVLDVHDNGDLLGGGYGIYMSTDDDTELNARNNGNIVGYYYNGIYVDSSANTVIDVLNNGRTTPPWGTYSGGGAGSTGEFPVGAIIGGEYGIEVSCTNLLDMTVQLNGDITGVDNDGAFVDCDDNITAVLDQNGDIAGGAGESGVDFEVGVVSNLSVTNNGEITGGDKGMDIDYGASATVLIQNNSPSGTITGGAGEGIRIERTGTGNDSRFTIDNNGAVSGGGDSDEAIDIDAGDSILTNITRNGNITGGSSGIAVNATSLTIHIDNNGNIHGGNLHGIDLTSSNNPSQDIVGGTISHNGIINGGGGDGLLIVGYDAGFPSSTNARVQHLVIDDNQFGNGSLDQGIEIACRFGTGGGAPPDCIGFDNTISNNIITGNGQQGILLVGDDGIHFNSNTVGQNNTITYNGGPGVHLIDTNDNLVVQNSIGYNGNITGGASGAEVAGPGEKKGASGGVVVQEKDQVGGQAEGSISGAVSGNATGNTISQNSIWNNVGLGIDLDNDGLNIDTPGSGSCADNATVPNLCIDTPPQPAVAGKVVSGRIGPPNSVDLCPFCRVEAFATDNPPDPTTYGEGFIYLGSALTDGTGTYSITVPQSICGVASGKMVTVTVTDVNGNTSEFSKNSGGFAGTPGCTPTPVPTSTPAPTSTPGPTATTGPSATPAPPTITPTATNTQPAPPTATATAVPPTATATTILKECGDVNDDGAVNPLDAQLILQLKAGLITSLINAPSADVDGNGQIQSIDALLILQHIAFPSVVLTC